ncbi:phage tail tape measure protein, partial [Helicobacter bizzozeronii]|uniref:phage tail tape measure protein n=1 Tax=Helicobacter bizzozeronii TaxID=56877 RepID=UPI001315095C
MAQIRNMLNLSMDEMVGLGDTINHVSNNSTAKAGDIIDILKRIGGSGKSFGLSAKEIAGLGSSMLDLGLTSDVAGTALSKLLGGLSSFDPSSEKLKGDDKKFAEWFDKMGLDADNWVQMRMKKPQEALSMFLQSLSKLDGTQQTKALKDIVGQEHLAKFQTLLGAMDKYKKVVDLANSSASKDSMENEFKAKASTTAHELKRLGAQMEVMWINVGDALLPIVNKIIVGIRKLITPIADFTKANQVVTRAILLSVAGVLAFKTAVIGLSILSPLASIVFTPLLRAWTLLRYSVLGNIGALLWHRSVSISSAAISLALRAPVLLLGGAYRLLTGQITLSSVATRVFVITSLIMANLFGGAMKLMRLAIITSGIGLLLVGLGIAGYELVNRWEQVKTWLIGIWEGFKLKVLGVWESLKGAFNTASMILAPVLESFRFFGGEVWNLFSGVFG